MPKPDPRRAARALPALMAAALAASGLLCGSAARAQTAAEAASLAPLPLVVQIVTATRTTDTRRMSLTGEIEARDTLAASFPTSGRIAEMMVQRGDHVAANAPLARIDSVQQEQALISAKAALANAQATYTKAKDDADRQDGLLEQGATTRSARDTASDTLRAAQASVAQTEADLDRAKKALADTVLLAPADATVTDRTADVGQVVGAAQPVLDLALGDRYDAIFHVPEVLLTIIPAKAPVISLSPLDHPDITFKGILREISPLVDATTGTVKVTLSVVDKPASVSFGDAVVGSVVRSETSQISLPWSAMSATAKGPAVWIVDPATHRVALRQVHVLRYETGRIVLADGVQEGELVVAAGSNLLFPGRVVTAAEGK